MRGTQTFDAQAGALADLGVPWSVIEYIRVQTYPRAYRAVHAAYLVGSVIVLLGVPIGAGFAVFRAAGRMAAARAKDGDIVVENHGWAALVLGFGLLFLTAVATSWKARGPFAEYCAIRGLLQARETRGVAGTISRWMVRKAAARVPSGEVHAFLYEQSRVLARWFVWPGSVLTAIGLALVPIDLGRYDLVDAAGVTHKSVFGTSSRRWDELDHIETGCAFYKDSSGEHASAIYDVVFAGGASTNLLMHAPAATLETLSRLDEAFRKRKVPVRVRLRSLPPDKGTPVWSPECIERVASALGTDDATLGRLLRPSER